MVQPIIMSRFLSNTSSTQNRIALMGQGMSSMTNFSVWASGITERTCSSMYDGSGSTQLKAMSAVSSHVKSYSWGMGIVP